MFGSQHYFKTKIKNKNLHDVRSQRQVDLFKFYNCQGYVKTLSQNPPPTKSPHLHHLHLLYAHCNSLSSLFIVFEGVCYVTSEHQQYLHMNLYAYYAHISIKQNLPTSFGFKGSLQYWNCWLSLCQLNRNYVHSFNTSLLSTH